MTLEQLNTLRKANGQEPLTELPEALGGKKKEDGGGAGGDDNSDTETPEQIEAKRKLAEEANKGKALDDVGKEPGELTDAQLLALLDKRGIKAANLDDLIKKEPIDEVKAAEQREAAEIAFGLTGGHFNKKEYDQFVKDFENPQELVYGEFFDETKATNPDMSDEDIQAEFLAMYGLDKGKDEWQHKRGLKLMKERAIALLNGKHKKIFSAKEAFSKTEKDSATAAETKKKVAAALPAYKRDVDEILSELKKITIKVSDEENIDLDGNDEMLTGIKEDLLSPEYYSSKLALGYDKVTLKQAIVAGVLAKNFTALTVKAATQYHEKHKAGTHGVPAGGAGAAKVVNMDGLTDAQKKYVELQKAEEARKLAAK